MGDASVVDVWLLITHCLFIVQHTLIDCMVRDASVVDVWLCVTLLFVYHSTHTDRLFGG